MNAGQILNPKHTALLIYDMTQDRVTAGRRYSQWAASGMPDLVRLVERCRQTGVGVCYALRDGGPPGLEMCRDISPLPDESLFLHPKSGAFYKTTLGEHLRQNQCSSLLLTGIALDYGISSTAREALNQGIHPILVRGACYAYDILDSPVGAVTKEELERSHFASLYRMGAGIMSVNEIIAALREE